MAKKLRVLNNPKRIDPTRTGLIRRKWAGEFRRRLDTLRRDVYRELLSGSYDVRSGEGYLTTNFIFGTVSDALKRFREWLDSRLTDLILDVAGVLNNQGQWVDGYVETSYFRGSETAAQNYLQKSTGKTPTIPQIEPWLRGPVALDKVRILKARNYEELKGVSQTISKDLGNILADGIVKGDSPRTVARTMSKQIQTITKKRAVTIARTETIRAHAEGQLTALKQLGVTELKVEVEFTATMVSFDPPVFEKRVCPKCRALQGKVFEVDKSSGIIPVHPNCRCAWVPYLK